jgi:DNA-binding MarR family transcriptional regulator
MNGQHGLDAAIHAPNRLAICAYLSATDEAEFATLRKAIDVSDSVLSKQLSVLADAGYVDIRKATSRGRVRTWVSLTSEGRSAFSTHLAALRELLGL